MREASVANWRPSAPCFKMAKASSELPMMLPRPQTQCCAPEAQCTDFDFSKASSKRPLILVGMPNANETSVASRRPLAPALSMVKASSKLPLWLVERLNVSKTSAASQRPSAPTFTMATASSKLPTMLTRLQKQCFAPRPRQTRPVLQAGCHSHQL